MNKYFAIFTVGFVALAALIGGLFGRLPARTSAEAGVTGERITSDYKEALDVIDQSYGGKVDHEKVTDMSMQAMLWTLDPHSSFFTRDEFR